MKKIFITPIKIYSNLEKVIMMVGFLFLSVESRAQQSSANSIGCNNDLNVFIQPLEKITEKVFKDIDGSLGALKTLEEWKDRIDNIEEMVDSWQQTEKAYNEWKNGGYEDFKAGTQFAFQIGESLRSIKKYIPFPQYLSSYFECLFDIIPILIEKFTAILDNHLQQIDNEYRRATGTVEYNSSIKCTTVAGGTCLVTNKMVRIIKSLNIPEYKKVELFRLSCGFGWDYALKHIND